MELIDFRCGVCNRLLARVNGEAQIKCPRCNTLNLIKGTDCQVLGQIIQADNRNQDGRHIATRVCF